MKWKNLFTPPTTLTTSEVKYYIEQHRTKDFQLVDVRQPMEYEEHHLPGAILIPLSELKIRYTELDRGKETIVYCRSGARSHSACQFLTERNFDKVFNMTGGILAWQGQRVRGSEQGGLEYFLQGDYDTVYELSCNLEAGLNRFYQEMAARSTSEGNKSTADLLEKMAQFEAGHFGRLAAMHEKEYPGRLLKIDSSVAEGGLSPEKMLEAFGSNLESPQAVLQLAMSFEAQAFDLYFRLTKRTDNPDKKEFFSRMAEEEQHHLAILSKELNLLLK